MIVTTNTGLSADELNAANENGFHVARGLFSPGEVAEIRDTFMAANVDGPVPGLSEIKQNGDKIGYSESDPLRFYPRMLHPHRHRELPVGLVSLKYMLDIRLFPILRDLLGEEPVAVQSMFYFKPPGARGQALHQDNFYLRVAPKTCMAAWFAIDDADEENGGMVIVPGTGRMDIVCPEKADSTQFFTSEHIPVPAGMRKAQTNLKAGDVLFFNGSLIHGSYPNRSKTRFRRSFICHYIPRSSTELARWYESPMSFEGELVYFKGASGGGPCGTLQDAVMAPH